MLGRAGLLRDIPCPFLENGLCERPYCHFKHGREKKSPDAHKTLLPTPPPLTAPTESNSLEMVGGYMGTIATPTYTMPPPSFPPVITVSTAPPPIEESMNHEEQFIGYTGYFADTSDTSDATATGDMKVPKPVIKPVSAKKTGLLGDSPKSSGSLMQSPRGGAARPSFTNLVKELSDIDRQIAKVQKQLEMRKFDSESPSEGYDPEKPTSSKSKQEMGKKSVKFSDRTTSKRHGKILTYTPTPISELQKNRPQNPEAKTKLVEKVEKSAVPKEGKAVRKVEKPAAQNDKISVQPRSGTDLKRKAEESVAKVSDIIGKKKVKKSVIETDSGGAQKNVTSLPKIPKKPRLRDLFGLDSEDEESSRESAKNIPTPTDSSVSAGKSPEELVNETVTEFHAKTEKKKKKSGAQKEAEVQQLPPPDPESLIPLGKPRTAHSGTHDVSSLRQRATGAPKAHLAMPKEQLQMRYKKLQKAKEEMLQRSAMEEHARRTETTSSSKQQPSETVVRQAQTGLQMHREGAIAATVPKGERRVAHMPRPEVEEQLKRPSVLGEVGSKVPVGIRQRYLNLFVEECLQIADSTEEAYKMAQEQEKQVNDRSTTKGGYMSAAVNAIKRFREQKLQIAPEFVPNRQCHPALSLSHQAVLGGKGAATRSFTVKRAGAQNSALAAVRQEAFLHGNLSPYVLSWQQLDVNGFPRPDPMDPNCPVFRRSELSRPGPKIVEDEDLSRNCSRCGKQYRLNSEGGYLVNQDCVYHWGKPWKRKGSSGGVETRFTCCGSDSSSLGCTIADHHVSDVIRRSDFRGFVQTRPLSPSFSPDDPRRTNVLALDCEMVYTCWGTTALARVSVVNWKLESVFEALVRPEFRVVDCNSRFSGLKMEDLEKATMTLEDVQERLVGMISSDTILMGHSLEGDLRALKLIHEKVVDTSVVFPHRLGPPYKRALKTLMAEVLRKRIQEADEGFGHDSKEDAAACMELMIWKVKEDLKLT